MRNIIIGVLFFGVNHLGYAQEISCKNIEDSGVESMSDYFEEIENADSIDKRDAERLLRKSVAAFHHSNYLPSMSIEEVDELGEGVNLSRVMAKNGKSFVSVNVGFGGGNSATYYYLPGTETFVPVMSNDGDCVDQGKSEEFPVEKDIPVEGVGELVCTFGDDAAFAEVSVKIPLGANGLRFNSSAMVTVAQPHSIVRRLELTTPPPQTVSISYDEKAKSVGFNLEASAKKGPTDWMVTIAARLSEQGARMFGRAYPLTAGGYHSKQAQDYRALGACHGSFSIQKVEYNRVVKF